MPGVPAVTRWQQVGDLWEEGWSVLEIAATLQISESQCWTELSTAQAYEARATAPSQWERMAVALAEFYDDPRAREWVYRQMGVARETG